MPAQTREPAFYCDPVKGSPDGDGSSTRPWRTMEEVLTAKLIELRDADGTSTNPDAPVKAGATVFLRSGWHGILRVPKGYNDQFITIRAEAVFNGRLAELARVIDRKFGSMHSTAKRPRLEPKSAPQ